MRKSTRSNETTKALAGIQGHDAPFLCEVTA